MKTPPKPNPSHLPEEITVESVSTDVVPAVIADDFIKSRIFTIRSVQVMLDRDLAILYGVPTKALNQAVKRNLSRFPEEFSFLLAKEEQAALVTNCDRFASAKHSSAPIRAFSEHGVIMVASILKSDIATATSVRITAFSSPCKRPWRLELFSQYYSLLFPAPKGRDATCCVREWLHYSAICSIAPLLHRIDAVERRQITDQQRNEERFDTIFKAMEGGRQEEIGK